ncbi:SnoaL-like protein [Kribbella voronezhensis]|uniref:SnoaL-like protein n=2 Tax=Kribbella voronezhensis TaxID=2512212 RepID=A0A4R7ST91_9ACTN|nr:SnoaL-like protein [Kribbella voronezhensis]
MHTDDPPDRFTVYRLVMTTPAGIPEPIQRALTAIDAQDNDAFVAAFAPDGYVDDWGRQFRGHAAIRSWSENELIGKQATFTDTEVSTPGNPLTIVTQVGGNGYNGPSHFTFETAGNQITAMTITA